MSDELVARFESSPSNGNVIVDARDIRIAALERELAEARALLAPVCADETLLGAIRNLQQAHLSEKGNAEQAEAALAALRQRHAEAVEAFTEIAKGAGAFNRDPLIHADNCIADMKAWAAAWLASEAKARLDNGSL